MVYEYLASDDKTSQRWILYKNRWIPVYISILYVNRQVYGEAGAIFAKYSESACLLSTNVGGSEFGSAKLETHNRCIYYDAAADSFTDDRNPGVSSLLNAPIAMVRTVHVLITNSWAIGDVSEWEHHVLAALELLLIPVLAKNKALERVNLRFVWDLDCPMHGSIRNVAESFKKALPNIEIASCIRDVYSCNWLNDI